MKLEMETREPENVDKMSLTMENRLLRLKNKKVVWSSKEAASVGNPKARARAKIKKTGIILHGSRPTKFFVVELDIGYEVQDEVNEVVIRFAESYEEAEELMAVKLKDFPDYEWHLYKAQEGEEHVSY
jgi:hypothetical protein